MMNTLLFRISRASCRARANPLAAWKQGGCSRYLSAHTWYRASLTSQETSSDSLEAQSSNSLTMMDAPETALGSIALNEVVPSNVDASSSSSSWSNSLSCPTPECDLVSWSYASSFLPTPNEYSDSMEMVDAPETALGSVSMNEFVESPYQAVETKPDATFIQDTTTLLHNHESLYIVDQPETALGSIALSEVVSKHTMEQIQQQYDNHDSPDNSTLPTSLLEYYQGAATDKRAMVVTSIQPPFQVVDVNDAWIGLCGYTRGESVDKGLGDLLQGPETNRNALQEFVKKLSHGEEAMATIVNYTKNGRKFVNRVHAGPLYNEVSGDVTHFVGVLTELADGDEAVVTNA